MAQGPASGDVTLPLEKSGNNPRDEQQHINNNNTSTTTTTLRHFESWQISACTEVENPQQL